jgi:hypothetical protein
VIYAGIVISLSIITALGIAVLENPQVQIWLEQQRVKIAELLRSIGEELDPESRRQAEAFAYEGRTPATDAGLRRESEGSREAAALATGRSVGSGTVRRIPVRGPSDPDEAEERRRKGREYLAKRNQQMLEMRERRKAANPGEGTATPPTPTSFDALVDEEGKLKDPVVEEKELPSPPAIEPVPENIREEMREVERQLVRPLLASESESAADLGSFQLGSRLANPFSDEYAMDLERSETPRPPPVPPKVELDRDLRRDGVVVPGAYSPLPEEDPEIDHEQLSYEEQLAIALSLSEAESAASTARNNDIQSDDEEDADLKAAIAASLKEIQQQQSERSAAQAETAFLQPVPESNSPLVDLTPPSPTIDPQARIGRSDWETLFDPAFAPSNEPLSVARAPASEASEDELYRLTPELTRARLATLNEQHAPAPYDPVREAAESQAQWSEPAHPAEASFYSAPSAVSLPPPSSVTMESEPELVDANEVPGREGARTPTTAAPSSFGFDTDTDSETFASVGGSRANSRAPSAMSDVEIIDVADDSDVDMLSEEGDGIATPDSWTEVGSRDGEESDEDRQHARL